MKYLTGNLLGSTDVRDLLDNAIGLDDALNDLINSTWLDRFGRTRKTLKGYEVEFEQDQAARAAAFQAFLEATGWSSLGVYAAGVSIVSHTQTVDYQGQPYQLKPSVPASLENPYVTTGNWAVEGVNFKLVGDNSLRQDLAVNGGAMVGVFGQTLTDYLKTQFADVQDFGADPTGAADSTVAFMSAAATGRPVHMSSLRTGGKAVYRVGLTSLPSNTSLIGEGVNSELVPLTNTSRAVITNNSSSATTFIDNLIFANFALRGSVVADGFAEQIHLMTLNGVRNVLVDNVNFIGFRGDGCYLGSGDVGGQERHNHNVTLRRCLFDGMNRDNRNALSIIDGTNVTVEDSVFQNCTRPNMPGAIDIEPDNASFHVIDGIDIIRNKFRNVGGNLGTVSLFMGSAVVPDPKNIRINDNDFDASVTTTLKADIFIGTTRVVGDGTLNSLVQIIGNNGRNGCRALDIRAIKGVRIEGNNWISYTQSSRFGIQNSTVDAPREVYHGNNRYIGNASAGGAGLSIGNIDYLTNDGNAFEECGNGAAGSCGIEYLAGKTTYVKHYRNKFKNAGGTMLQGVLYNSSGKSPATDTQLGDTFLNNLVNQFVAHETDMGWVSYTPTIVGAGTAGVGVYAANTYGRFMRTGKTVHFQVRVECTSHTGVGLVRVSVPVAAAALPDVTFPVGNAGSNSLLWQNSAAGFAVSCVMNAGAVIGGIAGGLGIYGYTSASPGLLGQMLLPASGSFMVSLSGTYVAA